MKDSEIYKGSLPMSNPSSDQNNQQPQFGIITQYIKDLSFENERLLEWIETRPNIEIKIDNAINNLSDDRYSVAIQVKIEAVVEEKVAFILEVVYEGVAFVHSNVPQAEKQALLCVHVPNLLFPFVRQIVVDVTSNAGIPPILLAPVDFASAFMAEVEKLQKQQNQSSLIH